MKELEREHFSDLAQRTTQDEVTSVWDSTGGPLGEGSTASHGNALKVFTSVSESDQFFSSQLNS